MILRPQPHNIDILYKYRWNETTRILHSEGRMLPSLCLEPNFMWFLGAWKGVWSEIVGNMGSAISNIFLQLHYSSNNHFNQVTFPGLKPKLSFDDNLRKCEITHRIAIE